MYTSLEGFYRNKNVLVAGGTGTIGIPMVRLLTSAGANVTVASLDEESFAKSVFPNGVDFIRIDLTDERNCLTVCKGRDMVFNLVGIKGSVGIGETKVASYLVPMLRFQTNLMDAAHKESVSHYLFVSSICAYPQSNQPKQEESAWDGMPRQNDRIPGLAKRIGEIQAEAYKLEYGWDGIRAIRPSNVFGPFDDFNPKTAQVIPALIARIHGGENPLKVWGNGDVVRDFIFSEDLAYWLLKAMKDAPGSTPINIGSGEPITIQTIVENIVSVSNQKPLVEWQESGPAGDPYRLLSIERARELIDYQQMTSLADGLRKTIEWFLENKDLAINGRRKH